MSIYKKISEKRMEIMGVAALMIFIYHFMYNDLWFANIPIGFEIESLIKKLGDSGVDMFLFISGMSLPNSMKHCNNKIEFYRKRMKRIVIPALLCSIVFGVYRNWSPVDYVLALTGIRFLITHIHFFLWYYCSMLVIYLLFPFYYEEFEKSKSKLLFGVLSIFVVLAACACIRLFTTRIDLLNFITKLPIFILGVLLNHYKESKILKYSVINSAIAVMFVFVGFKVGYAMKAGELGSELSTYFYLSLPYMFISLGLCYLIPLLLYIPYIGKIFVPFGKVSYEFYCSQIVYTEVVYYLFPDNLKNNVPVIFIFVITLTLFLYYANKCICGYVDKKNSSLMKEPR